MATALGKLESAFLWLFNLGPDHDLPKDPAEVLQRSFHITAKSRYNASIRLRYIGRFTFGTTILLSLGLILAPVLQLAKLTLAYPDPVINCFQIFLAVAVLVYSVVNATAGYDTRAHFLNDCGDRIKDLGRELRADLKTGPIDLKAYSAKYSQIIADAEMHSRSDYALAMLQASENFRITGLGRIVKRLDVLVGELGPYMVPTALLILEAIFILDILGVTDILTPYMQRMAGAVRAP